MTTNSSTFPSWLRSPALRQLCGLASKDVTQVTSVLMKAARPLAYCNLELKTTELRKKILCISRSILRKARHFHWKFCGAIQVQAGISRMGCQLLGCPFSATYSYASLEMVPRVPAPSAVLIFLHPQRSCCPLHIQISSRSSLTQYFEDSSHFSSKFKMKSNFQTSAFLQWISWFVTSAIGRSKYFVLHLFTSLKYSPPLQTWNF